MKITFLRHGCTKGNLEKRYVGTTDEPLCEEGRQRLKEKYEQKQYPKGKKIYTSPYLRCLETAALLYEGQELHVAEDWRECDFGAFEYKNYEELNGREEYQRWIDSGGTLPFPGGESQERMKERCMEEFYRIVEKEQEELIAVVHGGTIMSVLSGIGAGDYFDFQCGNGEGFTCCFHWDEENHIQIDDVEKIGGTHVTYH